MAHEHPDRNRIKRLEGGRCPGMPQVVSTQSSELRSHPAETASDTVLVPRSVTGVSEDRTCRPRFAQLRDQFSSGVIQVNNSRVLAPFRLRRRENNAAQLQITVPFFDCPDFLWPCTGPSKELKVPFELRSTDVFEDRLELVLAQDRLASFPRRGLEATQGVGEFLLRAVPADCAANRTHGAVLRRLGAGLLRLQPRSDMRLLKRSESQIIADMGRERLEEVLVPLRRIGRERREGVIEEFIEGDDRRIAEDGL